MDEQIRQILDEAEGNTSRDQLELSVAAGGQIEIAGRMFPAPAAAVLAMLEVIGSPFVADGVPAEPEALTLFRALYLIGERSRALPSVLRWKRREEALDRLQKQFRPEDSPQTAILVAEMLKSIADARADFDAAALRYGESLGAFSIVSATADLGVYLSLSGGFALLPEKEGNKKKDILTSTI